MTQLNIYETTAAVAAALPDPEREQFAALLDELTVRQATDRAEPKHRTVRRWLHDAGWERSS